ncbi:MAG: malto-oligosyltrehalose synthase [Chitinophagaceae bacterium]|nr:MAG: malto-oligosyltrehalose synthase [Chitinophagaceae bacterium]
MTIPSAAYRVQLNSTFNFSDLAGIIDYLDSLGITAVYASPLLQASKGSQHNYDINNPNLINEELGTEEELAAISAELRKRGIGWVQDIVPNHMNFDIHNVWLRDVFERGINSSYAGYFDIDWEHPFSPGKLMIPFLGEPLKDLVRDQKINLALVDDSLFITYYDKHYPVAPECYQAILTQVDPALGRELEAETASLLANRDRNMAAWQRAKSAFTSRLVKGNVRNRIMEALPRLNADESFIHAVLQAQHYVLCYHEVSNTQINYRRFFNVNSLICLRMEEQKVFDDYHEYIHSLYLKGYITGLRIDHVDGLKDPKQYIDRLRSLFGKDCYIIVEKILDIKEDLPEMDIQGTSGYEFLSYVNQVVTDRRGSEKLLKLYGELVPEFSNYEAIVFEKKFSFLGKYFNGEWDNLLRLLLSLDIIKDEEIRTTRLKKAIGVLMAAFPVYRAYIDSLPLHPHDRAFVDQAFEKAFQANPELDYELKVLQEVFQKDADEVVTANRLVFIRRLMQFTGPLAAKGVEDTTFFLYNPLISHNEVGDQPCVLGIPVREFHDKMIIRQQRNPLSFNCTSTHDTKRGEDNRMRINIISELADEWRTLVEFWQRVNEPFRKQLRDVKAPIVNDEYYLYQTLVGGFPETLQRDDDDFMERTRTFFIKVLRESKLMSDYIAPNAEYEAASMEFINHLLEPSHQYLPSILPFLKKIIRYANTYIMLQTILKTTAPGIPEIYRGCELWDLSYVDPDNRRPVDYQRRIRLLAELNRMEEEEGVDKALEFAVNHSDIGAEKMFVTKEILNLRKQNNELFIYGDYVPLYPEGGDRVVIAYFRHYKNDWVLVVLPLGIVENSHKPLSLPLPPGVPTTWTNIFTNEVVNADQIEVHQLLRKFPVAVLKNT